MLRKLVCSTDKIPLVLLSVFWLGVQLFFLLTKGVQTSCDSTVYLTDAQEIMSGSIPTGRSIWYLGYTFFLATFLSFQHPLWVIVGVQMGMSAIAAVSLYVLSTELTKNKWVGILAVFLYIFWVKIHQWNSFIYTESLYTSLSIIAMAVWVKSKKSWQYGLAFVLIVYTFFIRPTGFSWIGGLVWYLFARFSSNLPLKTRLLTGVLLLIGFLILLNTMLEHYSFIEESYQYGEVIYPRVSLSLEVPQNLYIPPPHPVPLIRLVLFVAHNPVFFAKMSLLRLVLFVGNVKPYFSWTHNLLIIGILYPLYFFAVKGWRLFPQGRAEKHFILGYCVIQTATITATSENWDGRFLVPLLPFIFILSAIGLQHTLSPYLLRLTSLYKK